MAQNAEAAPMSAAAVRPTGELRADTACEWRIVRVSAIVGFSLLSVSGLAVGIVECLFLRETAPRRVARH